MAKNAVLGWFLGVWICAGLASAQDAERALVVSFESSAANLPKEEIRAAIATELGRSVQTESDWALDELTISVDASGEIVLRYRSERGELLRTLPLPENRSRIPLLIALATENLAHNQVGDLLGQLKPDSTAPDSPPPPSVPPPASPGNKPTARPEAPAPEPNPNDAAYPRHFIGIHFAQDFARAGGSDACVRQMQETDHRECFYSSNGQRYLGEPFPGGDIANGFVMATRRVLLSYDYAASTRFTVGGRIGYAFADWSPAGASALTPMHLEARAAYWLRPLSELGLRPYVHAGLGVAQVETKVQLNVEECNYFLSGPMGGSSATTNFNNCVSGDPHYRTELLAERNRRVQSGEPLDPVAPTLDAYQRTGTVFLHAGGGVVWAITRNVGLQLNFNAMWFSSSSALVLEPSIGATTTL